MAPKTQKPKLLELPINPYKVDIIAAIDPDVTKSGLAILQRDTHEITLKAVNFPNLMDELTKLKTHAKENKKNFVLLVEAGWMNAAHWHITPKDTKQSAAAKGNATGRNHETGRKIIEMAKHYGIETIAIKPLQKIWNGKDKKITHEEFADITGYTGKRTNQEERDAAIIAWTWANMPLRLKSRTPTKTNK